MRHTGGGGDALGEKRVDASEGVGAVIVQL